jgi:type IV pilus assembly protein PilY1
VLAETLSSSGTTSPKSGWGTAPGATPARSLSTAEKLDGLPNTAIVNRVVLTTNDITNQGISFAWTSADATSPLSTNQKAYFTENGAVTDTVGENRVNFIRGDRSREDGITYRLRSSRQGDIVNSNIWYTGKPASNFSFSGYVAFAQAKKNRSPMIYVGGNDGMLHGFSASDGSEKIAYVPKGIMSRLPSLTKPGYTHQFFVDGSPFTGDVYSDDEWKTMLVGTLGAGGRGYFVLDVTDPTTFTVTDAATVVVLDNTLSQRATASAPADPSGTDADLGHIFSAPVPDAVYSMRASQIAKLNNGRWATVLGNGYNSVNEKPVLYIQYLDGTKEVQKINAIKAQSSADIDVNKSGNGLSAPRLVDINGDDQPDVVYAGDLKGNLWKFDISSSDSSEWDVAFSGSPLFVAYKRTNNNDNTATTANTSLRQPITVAPTVRPNERGRTGMMVAFGTGRNLTDADSSNTDVQSIYSVLDNTQYRVRSSSNPSRIEVHPGEDCSGNTSGCTPVAAPAVVTASDLLIQQSVSTTSMAGAGASSATTFWSSSSNAVDWKNNANIKGWYLNLPVSGERLLSNLSFYDGSNIMSVLTRVPGQNSSAQADEACSATYSTAQQYLSLLNIMDGLAPKIPLMDKNGDGYYSSLDSNASRLSLLGDGTSTTKTSDGFQVKSQGVNSANQVVSKTDNLAAIPILAIRPTWRQLQ